MAHGCRAERRQPTARSDTLPTVMLPAVQNCGGIRPLSPCKSGKVRTLIRNRADYANDGSYPVVDRDHMHECDAGGPIAVRQSAPMPSRLWLVV
jgi:hypothetical protein